VPYQPDRLDRPTPSWTSPPLPRPRRRARVHDHPVRPRGGSRRAGTEVAT